MNSRASPIAISLFGCNGDIETRLATHEEGCNRLGLVYVHTLIQCANFMWLKLSLVQPNETNRTGRAPLLSRL